MRVLMAIKPKYVERIFSSLKRFEFRKRVFREPVRQIVIYASSPVKKVVGAFDVKGIYRGSPQDVWNRCERYAGIEREAYDSYFHDADVAYAIEVENVVQYVKPLDVKTACGVGAPQSFCYLLDD